MRVVSLPGGEKIGWKGDEGWVYNAIRHAMLLARKEDERISA